MEQIERIEFKSYLLLGSGRLARHLEFYLNSLHLPLKTWSRKSGVVLAESATDTSHVLLAVSDRAIGNLASRSELDGKLKVHFSGARTLQGVHTAHPLMTFGPQLESPDWYRSIPFVMDEGTRLDEILPGLPNPSSAMAPRHRAFYHALCSLAGNSPFLLWQQIGEQFENTLKLPRHLLVPFLYQVVNNWSRDSVGSLTGPVARQDWETVLAHLEALKMKPALLQAYQTYLGLAQAAGHNLPEALL